MYVLGYMVLVALIELVGVGFCGRVFVVVVVVVIVVRGVANEGSVMGAAA